MPPIVTDILDFLTAHGLEVEGIFRRSAEISTIRTLQNRINKGRQTWSHSTLRPLQASASTS